METKATTPASTQNDQLAKNKSAAEKQFALLKDQGLQLVSRCSKINITDAITLSMANQVLSEAKELMKAVDKKRSEIKKPFLEMGKLIDSVAGEVIGPIEEALEKGKIKLGEWNKKQQEEVERLRKNQYQLLQDIKTNLDSKIAKLETVEQCERLTASVNAKWPADSEFGQYLIEANELKANYLTSIANKAELIKSKGTKNEQAAIAKVEESKKAVEETATAIEEQKEVVDATPLANTSKTRKVWKFEIVDESKMPRNFLSPDNVKIREYMNSKKEYMEENFKGECIVGGVRFYIDHTPQIS